MQEKCSFISAEEEQRNTQLFESSLNLFCNVEQCRVALQMTLYNYGRSFRSAREQYNHAQSPFSRFFFFENAGALLTYENGHKQLELVPGKRYFLTPGHPFHITYYAGSILYYAHFSVVDQTGRSIFRHSPATIMLNSPDSGESLKTTWDEKCPAGIISLLAHAVALHLSCDWEKLRDEYKLCSRFKPFFEFLTRVPPAQHRVKNLADSMNMTQAAFSRIFSDIMGISPKEYLTKYYFERACELLCFSGCSITETARLLGHKDIHNFFHVFKRIAGVSPANYRSKRRKNF